MNKKLNPIHEISKLNLLKRKSDSGKKLHLSLHEEEKNYQINISTSMVHDPKDIKIKADGNYITVFCGDQRFPLRTDKEMDGSTIEAEISDGRVIFYIPKKQKEPVRMLNDLALDYL